MSLCAVQPFPRASAFEEAMRDYADMHRRCMNVSDWKDYTSKL